MKTKSYCYSSPELNVLKIFDISINEGIFNAKEFNGAINFHIYFYFEGSFHFKTCWATIACLKKKKTVKNGFNRFWKWTRESCWIFVIQMAWYWLNRKAQQNYNTLSRNLFTLHLSQLSQTKNYRENRMYDWKYLVCILLVYYNWNIIFILEHFNTLGENSRESGSQIFCKPFQDHKSLRPDTYSSNFSVLQQLITRISHCVRTFYFPFRTPFNYFLQTFPEKIKICFNKR